MARRSLKELHAENESLRLRLEEAEQALEAIRTGQVESLVVEGPSGLRIFSLEGSTQSYRMLVESMNEGAATLGEEGTILYCNACFAGMLAVPLERVMGSSIHEHVPEHQRAKLEALLRSAMDGHGRAEIDLRARDGVEIPSQLSMSRIYDDGHHVLCLVATDLRAQKRNEEIVASERLARSVLEQAANAIVVCDERGVVIRASREAESLIGSNPMFQPFPSSFPVKLSPTGDDELPDELIRVALGGNVLRAAPALMRDASGAELNLLVSAAPLLLGHGQVMGCVITLVDVTEQQRAEKALREADQRKNHFLAMLSHELRNPLAPIKNSLYLLERVAPGSEQARRAQAIIARQVDQLARLVDDLLDMTRITSNKIQIQRQRLDLRELVRRTVDDYRSLFDKNGLRLELTTASEQLYVNADWNRLAQVIGNLLQNAAKFTGRGGTIRVVVSADAEKKGGVIRVSDTGAGMSPEMLSCLFEPFMQADTTLDRSKGGLGLGLALVKGLVELHGGTVDAYSEGPGRGAEFVVRIPLDTDKPALARESVRAKPAARRILLIEDNIDAAETLREVLELSEHEVMVAYSGPEGLRRAREFAPDVVLCDLGLPGMDGYEVVRAMRSDPALKDLFVVALSGYALPEDRERSVEAGFQQHLSKPPNLDKLEQLLESVPSQAND